MNARQWAALFVAVLALAGAAARSLQVLSRPQAVRPGDLEAFTRLHCRGCGGDVPLEGLFGPSFSQTNVTVTADGTFIYRCPACGGFETETVAELRPR